MTKRAVIITSSVIVGVLMVFTILFGVVFRVRTIDITYGEDFCYKTQIDEILVTSKLNKNTSIFDVERDKIASNIEGAYPYAKVDSVNLSSLTSVKITLSNRTPMYYFVQEAVYYILDEDCKVLEVTINGDDATGYIMLNNVFSATENTSAGEFLTNKYTSVCSNLYNALYTNAMIEVYNTNDQVWEEKYLEREDMCEIISTIKFGQVDELSGRVDKLTMATSFGVTITIIEPQKDLDYKINMAFSAFRVLQARDRQNSTTLTQSGSINVIYTYDENNNCNTICEYRA